MSYDEASASGRSDPSAEMYPGRRQFDELSAEDLHATKPQVGWLMAIYSLCQFVFSPLWGAFSDRFGRRPTILIGLAGNGVGLWMFGTADTVGMLFA